MGRLVLRCILFVLSIILLIGDIDEFDILNGMNFFKRFSPLHILWVVWMIDIMAQIVPVDAYVSIGSQKQFKNKFRPSEKEMPYEKLGAYVKKLNKAALKVFILWSAVVCLIGVMHIANIISSAGMIVISVFFYVCDLICVLFWCPFRIIMGNRCCTTCRIFNWDHLMMFGILGFVRGFYAKSLFVMSLVVFILWEARIARHPERFCETVNVSLRCSECTDKLCTQYCGR